MICSFLKHSCKLFIIALIVLCTVELCARIDDSLSYGAPFFSKYTSDRLIGSDEGISHNIPNARFEKWENNSLGFRGPNIQLNKKKGIQRIVCLGASESYGLYENPGMEWPAQLRNLLPEESFEIINASVAGLSLNQYLPYLNKFILSLNPDKVVLYVSPLFSFCRFEHNKKIPKKKKPELVGSVFQWRSRTRIKQALKKVLAENFPSLLLFYQLRNLEQQVKTEEEKYLKGKIPTDKVSNESVERYRDNLSVLVKFLKSRGIDVILVTYPTLISPTNIDQHPELFLDGRRFCIAFSYTGIINILDRSRVKTLEVAVNNKVDILDLSLLVPKSLYFFADNVHYTDKGAAVVAKLLAEKIITMNSAGSDVK